MQAHLLGRSEQPPGETDLNQRFSARDGQSSPHMPQRSAERGEPRDGIVQAGPQDTANKLRTAPLWGLRMRPRFMHDLRSLTLENAIERHKGEAEDVRERFFDLTEAQQQQLFIFLNSL